MPSSEAGDDVRPLAESSTSHSCQPRGRKRGLAIELEPADLVYCGPVRECASCDELSSSPNPWRNLKDHLLPSSSLWAYTFRPWNRRDSRGYPEAKQCQLCVYFAERAYQGQGGKKMLTTMKSGPAKDKFKAALKRFVGKVVEGTHRWGDEADLLVTTVSKQASRGLSVQEFWDFQPQPFLDEMNITYKEGELVDFHDESSGENRFLDCSIAHHKWVLYFSLGTVSLKIDWYDDMMWCNRVASDGVVIVHFVPFGRWPVGVCAHVRVVYGCMVCDRVRVRCAGVCVRVCVCVCLCLCVCWGPGLPGFSLERKGFPAPVWVFDFVA